MSCDRHALSGRLVVGLAGCDLSPAERRWLEYWRPAGVILFARNCSALGPWRRLVVELREVLGPDGELCADHEGGAVSFLQALAGRPPALRTLGQLDDLALTRRVHRQTGERLRGLGLDRVLAPCCDVLRESANPVIGSRSFGGDPDLVARHAGAAMAGLSAAGIKGCAKHWPGHGSSLADTHETAAMQSPGRIRPADRRPFLDALNAGADALMVGHLATGNARPPLTLDAQELAALRREFGPGILLYSDDVSMGALRAPLAAMGVPAPDDHGTGLADPSRLSFEWLRTVAEAGCDRMLLRGIPWNALPLPAESGPVDAGLFAAESGSFLGQDLLQTGPPAPVYAEARRRAAADVALRHGMTELYWFDATGGDRLGEAAGLMPSVRSWWPRVVRIDAATGDTPVWQTGPGGSCPALLVTSHRPLTVDWARMIGTFASVSGGTALAAGHPSLSGALRGLLKADWRIDALFDCAAPDLAALSSYDQQGSS